MKKKSLLMILQADNIENDYRLIKQCEILIHSNIETSIYYFHSKNFGSDSGLIRGSIKWSRKKCLVRQFAKPGALTTVKLLEQWFYGLVKVIKQRPGTVCLHDERLFGLIPILYGLKKLGLIDNLVWDLRELPDMFLAGNSLKKRLLKVLIGFCDSVASANKERNELIIDALNLSSPIREKLINISNYPDERFSKLDVHPVPLELANWLDGSKYIYGQSLIEPTRYFYNTVEAIINDVNFKLVLTGRVSKEDLEYFENEYGDKFNQQVFCVGLVDPYELPRYIDHACASIVLYDDSSDNRKYCAPNRLFQSLSRGVPVIVGNNPSMSNIIVRDLSGVVLESDGKNIKHISGALVQVKDNMSELRQSTQNRRYQYIWEEQTATISEFLRLNS